MQHEKKPKVELNIRLL